MQLLDPLAVAILDARTPGGAVAESAASFKSLRTSAAARTAALAAFGIAHRLGDYFRHGRCTQGQEGRGRLVRRRGSHVGALVGTPPARVGPAQITSVSFCGPSGSSG